MASSFQNGKLTIDEEIRLKIPTPLDISIPVPPPLPSFDFPAIPDVAGDLIKIEARISELEAIQAKSPSFSVDVGGGVQAQVPSAGVNYDDLLGSISISLPVPPPLPSFDFPPIPDVPGDIIKIKARIDELKALQAKSPAVSVDVGLPDPVTIPSAGVDFEALEASISIPTIVPPVLPNFQFPEIPDPTALFGNLGIDTELYKKSANAPGLPGYSPTAPEIVVKVFVNDVEV